MSLVGRLDDLSLADIIQIVHLSRRTGTLEIVDGAGLHALLFWRGLIVNGSSPGDPDLIAYLATRKLIPAAICAQVATLRSSEVPAGDALIDLNVMSADALAAAVRERVLAIIQPLLHAHEGEFTFRLNESLTPFEIGFEPKHLFKEGGLTPQKIFGSPEKLKPLRGLEESLKAGKALMSTPAPPPLLPAKNIITAPVKPIQYADTRVAKMDDDAAAVVVCERNALLRVAMKRAFTREGIKIAQFGNPEDARVTMNEWFSAKRFFVSVLERNGDPSADRLVQLVKRRNQHLPIVVLETAAGLPALDVDRRIVKPQLDAIAVGDHARELGAFADDVVLSAQYALSEWDRVSCDDAAAAARLYERADAENLSRRGGAVRQLINTLSDGHDVGDVAGTVLRVLEEYVDRGALFLNGADAFIGVSSFGANGTVSHARIPRSWPSILSDVVESLVPHHGKLRRTEANVMLMKTFGGTLPTEVVALPIVHRGRALGVVYGDNAHHCAPIESTSAVELFLFHAADAFANALAGVHA